MQTMMTPNNQKGRVAVPLLLWVAGVPFTLVSTPVQFNGEPAPTTRGPEFNEHGDEILTEKLGLDWDTIVDLKVKGIVG